jgi:branched-chain amino acid transport system substrate-binding protein
MQVNRRRLISVAAAGLGMAAAPVVRASEPGISRDRIKLGAFLPLQSGLAAGATQMKDGADAYFRWLNDQGGIHGRKIEWIVENDSYNPQQAVAVARKLIDRDGVFAFVSTLGTVTNLAVLPLLAQRKVPIINPAGSNEKLNAPTDRNVFGMLPVGQKIGEHMANFALERIKAERIAVYFQNDDFGKDQRDGAVAFLKAAGKTPVAEASYVPSDVDVSAQAIALRNGNPQVVLMFNITKHGVLLLQEATKLGWKPQFIAMNTMADPIVADLAGDSANGLICNIMTAVDVMDNPQVRQANEILKKYNPQTRPGYFAYLGFAGAIAFHRAAQAAGPDLTRDKLILALEGLGKWSPGVVPPLDWSAKNHGGPTSFGYVQWKGKQITVLQSW